MELFKNCNARQLANGLTWMNEPPEWGFEAEGLTLVPQARTDFFRPCQGAPHDNACLLYVEVTGDFTAVTHARAHLVGFGDGAAITVRQDATQWAKLCLERSPFGEVAVVSVVTDGWSDDANNELLTRPECFLRLTRKGTTFGMHYSQDGGRWRFVRTFGLAMPAAVKVGIHAQAPFVRGCQASFSTFALTAEAVRDFRSGE